MTDDRPVIAHVLHRLDRAGAEVLAAGIAQALRDRFRFVFFCLDGLGPLADQLAQQGFHVEHLARRPGIDWALTRRLRHRLRTHRVQAIHAHQYTPFFYSALARGVTWQRITHRTTPILFTEHGRHYPDRRSTRRVWANKLLLKKHDRVTAVGQFVSDALTRNEGISPARISVIYNGIEPSTNPPTDADRAQARQQLSLDPACPVVMQVARFHPVKDHATAIQAFANLRTKLPSAKLVLVGDGQQRQAMQQRAQQLGLGDAVHFTGPVEDARALIPAADACMLTSLSEGISVTLLEAMAHAKPIVATNVGGNPELITHNTTGLLAPRGDAHALANHLHTLLTHPDQARALGQAGHARLLTHFTADRMHQAYAQQYQAMLASTPA